MKFIFNSDTRECAKNDIDVFQDEARRTLRNDLPYEMVCSNMCMGLSGETGEVVDALKKHIYQGKDLDINEIIEEVGDVLWYVANLCNVNEITMRECMESNMEKLKKRYPNGFSIEDALARVDKQGEK